MGMGIELSGQGVTFCRGLYQAMGINVLGMDCDGYVMDQGGSGQLEGTRRRPRAIGNTPQGASSASHPPGWPQTQRATP